MSKYMWVVFVLGWHLCLGQAVSGPLRVYVFLSPECPLCQNYTRTLNQLDKQYAGRVTFYGVIPGKTWKTADVSAFRSKYHVAFSLQIDSGLHITHAMHATTTPEVILIGSGQAALYEGAIDNWYKALGRAGSRPTQHYLQDAIESVLHHEAPLVRKTTPVGCLINDF